MHQWRRHQLGNGWLAAAAGCRNQQKCGNGRQCLAKSSKMSINGS
jgi:hypothetical protein